jgi:hypothetical protein
MYAAIQYLTRKTNEIFEARMREAAREICQRQSMFQHRSI